MITVDHSLKSYSFRYNFTTDTGAQGLYFSPFTLPGGAACILCSINTIVAPQSVGGLNTLSLGLSVSAPNMFQFSAPQGNYIANNVLNFTDNGILAPWFTVATGGEKLVFTIQVEDLTAGLLDFTIIYVEF